MPFDVAFDYATTGGTAAAGTDYEAASGRATIAAGQTSVTIPVAVLGDAAPEADETIVLTFSQPANATLGSRSATATIRNDDTVVTIADAVADESAGELVFAVTLSQPVAAEVILTYSTANGTARTPGDYTTTKGTLVIPAGATQAEVRVPLVDDTLDEADETFALRYTVTANAVAAATQANATIRDDDSALRLGDTAAFRAAGVTGITEADVQPIREAALKRWRRTGLDAADLAELDRVQVLIVDLPEDQLGLTSRGVIYLDADAAGASWYLDARPGDDAEFRAAAAGPPRKGSTC